MTQDLKTGELESVIINLYRTLESDNFVNYKHKPCFLSTL